jgi:hypothetical protein
MLWKTNRALEEGEPSLFQNNLFRLHFATQVSWLFGIYIERGFFLYPSWPYELKKIFFCLVGLGLKYVVVSGVGFLANFTNILELNSHNPSKDIFDSRFAKC